MKNVLGIDIGGTKIAVCLANEKGEILGSERFPSTKTCEEAVDRIASLANDLLEMKEMTMADVACCGISAPGPLDTAEGLLLRSPNLGWADRSPIAFYLEEKLGVPAILENDANAGALAEWFFGHGNGKSNMIYMTMSTGVGAGVICEGKLLHGVNGNAGEVGHICLDINGRRCNCGLRGCLEAYTGGQAVQHFMQSQLKDDPRHEFFSLPCVNGKVENLNFKALLEGVKAKIPLALEWWDEYCLRLAQGIGIIGTCFNPELIVLGTTSHYAGDLLMKPLRELLPRFMWRQFYEPLAITDSALGIRIGEMAGVSVAYNNLYEKGIWAPPA